MNRYFLIFIFAISIIFIIFLVKFFKENFNGEKSYTEMAKSLLKDDYERIMEEIKYCRNSKEILSLLEKEKKIKLFNKNIKVKNLVPLQKSIDINKTLYYLLKDHEKVENILSGKSPFGENRIFICEDNTYILDGHHRWFQIYILNSECEINSLEINGINKYFVNFIKKFVENVNFDNDLLKMSENDVENYINRNISDKVINVFKKYNKGKNKYEITKYLLYEINKIKKNVFSNK